MARLYRPTITRYVDAYGNRCRKDAPGAKKVRGRSRTWRGMYRDGDGILRQESLCSNKQASRQMLAQLQRQAWDVRAGLAGRVWLHQWLPLPVTIIAFR